MTPALACRLQMQWRQQRRCVLSQVAADFQSQASSAVAAKGSRPNAGSQKAQSSRFDDLLNAIPDAPPEPRAAKTDAPERPQPAEARTSPRDERAGRPSRDNRPARTDRAGTEDAIAGDSTPPASEATPAKDAGAEETAAVAADPKSADTAATADTASADTASADTDGHHGDGAPSDATAVIQAAVEALVPQAAATDPAVAMPVVKPTVDGDAVVKTGAAKVEAATAATPPSIKTAEQQAAMLTDQTTGLSADDAEVLSALAVKAQQGLKNAEGDATAKKTADDKPAHVATLAGKVATIEQTAQTGQTSQMAQADGAETNSAETRSTETKPIHSDLAKVGVEHRRDRGDSSAKTAGEAAPATGNANAATVKIADNFAAHLMTATGNATHAFMTSSGNGAATAPSANADKPVAVANVAVEVSAKISSGKNQFDIRLDPEELGRIHVKVNVDRDGNVTTHMVADRPDTLDLLRRDTQGLERALQDAGLKTSDNSLQFSLRDQAQQNQQNPREDQASGQPAAEDELATTIAATVIARDYGRYGLRPSGLDIRV